MDMEMGIGMLLAAGVIELLIVVFIVKYFAQLRAKWTEVTADGKVTLDEVMDVVDEVQDIVEEVRTLPSLSALKKMKKDELVALAEEHGVSVEGTKADLISALGVE
jgi:hypothetical protein